MDKGNNPNKKYAEPEAFPNSSTRHKQNPAPDNLPVIDEAIDEKSGLKNNQRQNAELIPDGSAKSAEAECADFEVLKPEKNRRHPEEPSGLKPEEIMEIEQSPPEAIITREDMEKAGRQEIFNLSPKIILPSDKRRDQNDTALIPAPKIETELNKFNQQKLRDLRNGSQNSTGQKIAEEEKTFMQKYLKKLSEFRRLANAERRRKKEKNLELVMEYARRKNRITNDEVEKITGVKHSQAANYLNILVKRKQLIRFGAKSGTFYGPLI